MDTAVVQQFLNLFQDFINICQLENWPNNDTTEEEIKNAFLLAIHIEKCVDRLQKKLLIDDFLATLNSIQSTPCLLFKKCLCDPPKYILRKVVTSTCKVTLLDVSYKIFLNLFSEEKLELCLSDLMTEAASKETLVNNLSTEFPKDKLVIFKSQFILIEFNDKIENEEAIINMLNNGDKETIELLIVCMLNKGVKFCNAVNLIVNSFISFMTTKNCSKKKFWRDFLNTEKSTLTGLFLNHGDLYKIVCKALMDCGRLLKENMSAEYFYIDLTYSELVRITNGICENENLKLEFMDIVNEKNDDVKFWEIVLS
ncbi:uncharacterized protein LOC123701451 isoform X1 [Colias croceus]|uniref:uncharacterized protein LOC123701451 isoform X1 n=1 Tax=Colias crocea TaxID=72248 RepID=UPI001E27C46C|nr:uncharacterized protein LOC123701451 isoform X1 [Colias croceus]